MVIVVEFLKSYDDLEDARDFRDEIQMNILNLGLAPQTRVGIRRMVGCGGYAVELHREEGQDDGGEVTKILRLAS